MTKPLVDTSSPEFLQRVDSLTKIVNSTLGRFDEPPQIVIPVLMRMLCVEIVSETYHLPWSEVKRNTLRSFRGALEEAKQKMDAVLAKQQADDAQQEPS